MYKRQQKYNRRAILGHKIRQIQRAARTGTPLPGRIKEQGRRLKVRAKPHTRKLVFGAIALLVLSQPLFLYVLNRNDKVVAATATTTLRPDGDSTAGWDLCNNAACGGTAHYTLVDETTLSTADYVNLSTTTTPNDGEIDDYTVGNPTISGTFLETTKVDVKWYAVSMACNGNNPSCDAVTVNIFINGSLQTGQQTSLGAGTTPNAAQLYTTTFNGNWGAINDLRIVFTRNRVGGGNSNNADDDVRLYQAYADVTYSYIPASPLLALKGYVWENNDGQDSGTATSTRYPTTATNDTGIGTQAWTGWNSVLVSDDIRTQASVDSISTTSNYLKTTGYGFSIPSNATIAGIRVLLEGRDSGSPSSDFHARLVKGGTILTTDKSANWPNGLGTEDGIIPTSVGGTSDLWSETWTPQDINSGSFGAAVYGVHTGGLNNNIQADSISIEISYSVPEGTQLAAGNTGITMRAGERATLRAQLRNTGGPVEAQNLGLFYDHGDGIWRKVKQGVKATNTGGTGCADSDWTCTTIDSTNIGGVGRYTSIAFDPSGNPWVSYYSTSGGDLNIARYVGSGGTGCIASSAWTCFSVDTTNDVGQYTSIAFDASGNPWVSYRDVTNSDLRVARYLGGAPTGTGCAINTWTCTAVESANAVGQYTSIAFDASGNPWVSYNDLTNNDLRVARYLGGATTGTGCAVNTWTCTAVDTANLVGTHTSIAFDPFGNPWVSYKYNTDSDLRVARYLGGATTGTGCAVNTWTCTTVETANSNGDYSSIAFDPSGNPWVSHFDSNGFNLRVARYLGGATTGTGCAVNTWTCTAVDTTDIVGEYSSIAFDPSGNPWVSYYDNTNTNLRVARFVGSGGTGCADSAWTCISVDTADTTGQFTSIAFDPSGKPWVSYFDTTNADLKVTNLASSSGEIIIVPTYGGAVSLTESHADMTAYDNTANRDDADCITSGTWNNGKYFTAEEGSGLVVADGQGTPQCTEVAFTINTSQAVAGQTYRFMIATDDATRQDRGKWRGMAAIENFPTLTIEDDSIFTTHQTYSKDSLYDFGCSSTHWCKDDAVLSLGGSGSRVSIAVDTQGNPWIAAQHMGNSDLMVARYVGSGGSCGNAVWDCTTVDATGTVGAHASIAFDPAGNPWVSYLDGVILNVANYVGSGGNCDTIGAGSDAWNCSEIENSLGTLTGHTSIAFDPGGNPWISFIDPGYGLRVAKYVGSGGTGCVVGASTTDAWSCAILDGVIEAKTSIAFDSNGKAWISYAKGVSGAADLGIATYVGYGGSCNAGSVGWDCTTVDVTDNVGLNSSLAVDPSGNPWVSYYDNTNLNLEVARYVGSGGNCDTVGAGSDAWECASVATTGNQGVDSSIAFDASGTPWISYTDSTDTSGKIARYVISGGDCDSSEAGSDAWVCTRININSPVRSVLAFDRAGNPVIAYLLGNNVGIIQYNENGPLGAPIYSAVNTPSSRNANNSYGRFALSGGKPSGSTSNTCTGAAEFLGICGVANEDGQHETVVAPALHRPMFQMRARFDNNAVLPTVFWVGNTTEAPSGNNIKIQAYRYGSTNAWEDIKTFSGSCSDNCSISAIPSGTASEYYQTDGSNYWFHARIIQVADTTNSITFKTDSFKAIQQNQQMRHGRTFNRGLLQPFLTEDR